MSFPSYDAYRDSGVEWIGAIPQEWDIEPLFAVSSECDDPNLGMRESNLLSLSYGKIKRKNIHDNDGLLPESFETYQIVEPGDIVWRLTDLQNDRRSLRTALVEERGIITSAYLATRSHGIRPRYLNYLLRAYDQLKVFYSMGGGLRQSMKFSDVKRLPVLLPPDHDQDVISTFLDRETRKIDALVEEKDRLVALLTEKRQAIISHAVTRGLHTSTVTKCSGVEWLGNVPAHWKVCPLKRVFRQVDYGISDSLNAESGVGVLRMGNIENGRVSLDDLKFVEDVEPDLLLRPLDLLFNRTNSLDQIGKVGLLEAPLHEPLTFASYLVRIRLNENAHPHYMAFLLNTPMVLGEARSRAFVAIGQCNLNPTRYGLITLAFPPLEEQIEIARWIQGEIAPIDRLAAEVIRAKEILMERKAALILEAATGRIDVRQSSQVATDVRDAACAEIIRLCAQKRNFGRVKMQKLIYLAEAHVNVVEIAGDYSREAAGPLDRSLIQSVERSLREKQIVDVQQGERGSPVIYTFTGQAGVVRDVADQMLGVRSSVLRDLLKKVGELDTLSVEGIATLYAVWNDALIDGEVPDEPEIIRRVLEDWHPEKAEKFNSEGLSGWLAYMRRNSITPQGRGPRTRTPRLFP